MKRFIVAASLAAAVVVPVAQAGAVPPGNSSVPLGSTNGCFVVATPAVPGTCNFLGDSAQVGIGGFSTDGYTITHQRKFVRCTTTTPRTVSEIGLETVTTDSESGTNYIGDGPTTSWQQGIVNTLTIKGNGFAAVGGPGDPDPAMASDPQVGPSPAFVGAEGSSSQKVGDNC